MIIDFCSFHSELTTEWSVLGTGGLWPATAANKWAAFQTITHGYHCVLGQHIDLYILEAKNH